MQTLALLWITFALNYIDRQMVYSMLPALEKDLGFTASSQAWIGTLFLWSYTPALPLAGLLADRLRRDRLILVSLLLWSAATLGCGTARTPGEFLCWRALMGITEALYYPTALALIAGHFAESQRSRMLGIHQSAQFAGGIAGGWFGGWAADHTGWRSAFLWAGIAGWLYSAVLWRGLPESRPAAGTNAAPAQRSDLWRNVPYLLLMGTFSSYCSIQWILLAWFPLHLKERFGLSMTDSGFYSTFSMQASLIVGILAGGALADRWRARLEVTSAGAFLCAPFAWLAFSAGQLWLALVAAAGFGLFAGGLSANAFAAAFDLLDARLRGFAAGVLNMAGGLVSGAMILVAGNLRNDVAKVVLAAMAVTMVLAVLSYRAGRAVHRTAAIPG